MKSSNAQCAMCRGRKRQQQRGLSRLLRGRQTLPYARSSQNWATKDGKQLMEEQIGCLSWLDGIRFEAKGIVNPASGEIPVVCASQMRLRCSRPPCWAKCIFASFSSSYYIETRNPELFGLKVFEAQDLRWWICPNAAVSEKPSRANRPDRLGRVR